MAVAESIDFLQSRQEQRRQFMPTRFETFFDLIAHFAATTPNKPALIDVS
jgi:hypothetical protein